MNVPGPSTYLAVDELSELEKRFTEVLENTTCLVFWTGVPPNLPQEWAKARDMKTLVAAMGPLYSDKGPGS